MARKQSKGEIEFLHWWNLLSEMPPPKTELEFAKHTAFKRNWRFDFYWEKQKVAVEIDGGTWMPKHGKKSRHVSGTGFQDDCVKLNAAVILGWRVLRFTPTMMAANPIGCIEQIKQVLDAN